MTQTVVTTAAVSPHSNVEVAIVTGNALVLVAATSGNAYRQRIVVCIIGIAILIAVSGLLVNPHICASLVVV